MSHERPVLEIVTSRRSLFGAGLLLASAALLGAGVNDALAQAARGGGKSGSTGGGGGGGGGGDVIPPGTPGNCPAGASCGGGDQQVKMLVTEKPKPKKKRRIRARVNCGRRPDGTVIKCRER